MSYSPPPIDPRAVSASRRKLLLIVLVFMAPILAALALTVSGWQPTGRGHGQAIVPQRNLLGEKVRVVLDDGSTYPWRDTQPRMTLLALASEDCAAQCMATLTNMTAARITLNQRAPRLRLLYLGPTPVAADRKAMTRYWQFGHSAAKQLARYQPNKPDSVSAVLVESNGTALSYYPAGFDPTGLRQDLQKVIR